ncbi:hypothetical protein HKBW3C_01536 [Candidatus Hakubella thermalkaliphila]|nr:hypothetical protein HKBW3C_01536 [Candidatus Hakubella thermalkaliphila]
MNLIYPFGLYIIITSDNITYVKLQLKNGVPKRAKRFLGLTIVMLILI